MIVPVRNGGSSLSVLLTALNSQTIDRERFEVIIADDGSTDGYTERLNGDRRIHVLRGPPQNSYAARNRAVAAACAPVIAFTDADCIPEATWLEAGLQAVQKADVVAGSVRFLPPKRCTVWALLQMDGYLDQEKAVRHNRGATANLFVRRELFDRVGSFNESFPNGSDYEFVANCVAAGARLVFERCAAVWHPTNHRARPFLRKLWAQSRYRAARVGASGRGPGVRHISFWCPPLAMLMARRTLHSSLGPDPKRLEEHGVRTTRWQRARALPAMYVVWPLLVWAARLVGWCEGRRCRA